MKPGFVYILKNSSYPDDLLKIGMTTRTPEIRAREIFENSTGVPHPFEVFYKHKVSNCELAEKIIHKRLVKYRNHEYREFFKIPGIDAINIIESTCKEIEGLYCDSKIIDSSSRKGVEKDINIMAEEAKRDISEMSKKALESINSGLEHKVIEHDKGVEPIVLNKTEESEFKWKWYYWFLIPVILKAVYLVSNGAL